jgi:hypothetical protein
MKTNLILLTNDRKNRVCESHTTVWEFYTTVWGFYTTVWEFGNLLIKTLNKTLNKTSVKAIENHRLINHSFNAIGRVA